MRDSTVDKVITLQAWGLEFRAPQPTLMPGGYGVSCNSATLKVEENRCSEADWLA